MPVTYFAFLSCLLYYAPCHACTNRLLYKIIYYMSLVFWFLGMDGFSSFLPTYKNSCMQNMEEHLCWDTPLGLPPRLQLPTSCMQTLLYYYLPPMPVSCYLPYSRPVCVPSLWQAWSALPHLLLPSFPSLLFLLPSSYLCVPASIMFGWRNSFCVLLCVSPTCKHVYLMPCYLPYITNSSSLLPSLPHLLSLWLLLPTCCPFYTYLLQALTLLLLLRDGEWNLPCLTCLPACSTACDMSNFLGEELGMPVGLFFLPIPLPAFLPLWCFIIPSPYTPTDGG